MNKDPNCIFCRITSGEIPSQKIFENEKVLAFRDINPQAKVHILVVPKNHIVSVNEIDSSNIAWVSEVFLAIPEVAKAAGLSNGYRVITNSGADGCQSVPHLHFHIVGGEKLSERMA